MPTTRANCSSELVWAITRDTSCFRMKQRSTNKSGLGKSGAEFSKEPNNLTGRNTWKYSALSNAKSVGLEAAADGGCVLTTKSRKSGRVQKPNKLANKTTMTGGFRKVAKALTKEIADNHYRSDLLPATLAKWSLIHASQKKGNKKK